MEEVRWKMDDGRWKTDDGRRMMEDGRRMMEDVIILHLNSHLTFYSDERVVLLVLRNLSG